MFDVQTYLIGLSMFKLLMKSFVLEENNSNRPLMLRFIWTACFAPGNHCLIGESGGILQECDKEAGSST